MLIVHKGSRCTSCIIRCLKIGRRVQPSFLRVHHSAGGHSAVSLRHGFDGSFAIRRMVFLVMETMSMPDRLNLLNAEESFLFQIRELSNLFNVATSRIPETRVFAIDLSGCQFYLFSS
jgi:hypothetical protein